MTPTPSQEPPSASLHWIEILDHNNRVVHVACCHLGYAYRVYRHGQTWRAEMRKGDMWVELRSKPYGKQNSRQPLRWGSLWSAKAAVEKLDAA